MSYPSWSWARRRTVFDQGFSIVEAWRPAQPFEGCRTMYARSSIARIAAGLLAASLIVLTGCSSSGSGSTGAQASGVQVSGSAFTGTTPLKSATVGILGSNMSSPTVVSLADTAKQALAAVGWKSEIVDGQGNPATAATGLTQFTTEKVAAI
ncbi:MAG: sugar transporter substrate-binding protein, partial [Pseudonocardia sp.]|nr:sugar transporter substrate-binding protein [Pseudonocardia sp.]